MASSSSRGTWIKRKVSTGIKNFLCIIPLLFLRDKESKMRWNVWAGRWLSHAILSIFYFLPSIHVMTHAKQFIVEYTCSFSRILLQKYLVLWEYWRDIIVVNAVGIVRPTDHTLADVFLMNHDNNTTFTGNADQEELHVKFNRQIHKSKQKESLHTSFQFIYFLFQTRILLGCLYLCIWWMSSRYSC